MEPMRIGNLSTYNNMNYIFTNKCLVIHKQIKSIQSNGLFSEESKQRNGDNIDVRGLVGIFS